MFKFKILVVVLVLAICSLSIAILTRQNKIVIERPSGPLAQGDVVLYERELFAIGYATRALEEDPFASKFKYYEYRKKGQQVWDAAKVGETK